MKKIFSTGILVLFLVMFLSAFSVLTTESHGITIKSPILHETAIPLNDGIMSVDCAVPGFDRTAITSNQFRPKGDGLDVFASYDFMSFKNKIARSAPDSIPITGVVPVTNFLIDDRKTLSGIVLYYRYARYDGPAPALVFRE